MGYFFYFHPDSIELSIKRIFTEFNMMLISSEG
jgi:hypothetical protein